MATRLAGCLSDCAACSMQQTMQQTMQHAADHAACMQAAIQPACTCQFEGFTVPGTQAAMLLPAFTATMVVPGATPTTPWPLFLAATLPAQCVPWPFLSSGRALDRMQLAPESTLRSGWFRDTPVSSTATATSAAGAEVVVPTAPTRRTPVGADWLPLVTRGTASGGGDGVRAWRCCFTAVHACQAFEYSIFVAVAVVVVVALLTVWSYRQSNQAAFSVGARSLACTAAGHISPASPMASTS